MYAGDKFGIIHEGDIMEFQISIDQFEGPLDLMLHLIKTNKLDLMDLDMNTLATQYIAYIAQMKQLQLEIASEYLSELASLIEYKSRKLLPRSEVAIEEEYEEDQREKLVSRLIEYQKYKDVSGQLKARYEDRQRHFARPASSLIDAWAKPKEDGVLRNQSVYELSKAFERVLHRLALLEPYETKVSIKEISVEERVEQIEARMRRFDSSRVFSFQELCQDCVSLHMVIVTFLGILDMIHDRKLTFHLGEDDTVYVQKGAIA